MSIVNNPHDRFFKETFSNINIAQDFISNFLPEEILQKIDIEGLGIVKGSFIERVLTETFSDILYKVKINQETGYIYILFEHKSYPYRLISLQLLKYLQGIWELIQKQTKRGTKLELPLVIPLVIYHGKKKWNIGKELSALFKTVPEGLNKYLPDFEYILYDFSEYNIEKLKGEVVLRIFLNLIRYINSEGFMERLNEVLNLFRLIKDKETATGYFETVMRYILSTRDDLTIDDLKEAVEEIIPERSENIMTVADRLKKEGEIKGERKGAIKELKYTISVLLNKKLKLNESSNELSGKIESLDLDQLRRIRDNIFDIASLEDITKYIN